MHLKTHAGEVAFPGGMWDSLDSDLLQTALREANEEVGLQAETVKPIATLPTASPEVGPHFFRGNLDNRFAIVVSIRALYAAKIVF